MTAAVAFPVRHHQQRHHGGPIVALLGKVNKPLLALLSDLLVPSSPAWWRLPQLRVKKSDEVTGQAA